MPPITVSGCVGLHSPAQYCTGWFSILHYSTKLFTDLTSPLFSSALLWTALHCTDLDCSLLCIPLHYSALPTSILFSILLCSALPNSLLCVSLCTALHCTVLGNKLHTALYQLAFKRLLKCQELPTFPPPQRWNKVQPYNPGLYKQVPYQTIKSLP